MTEFEKTLIELIAKATDAAPATLSPTTLITESGLDSMGVVELIFDIEETWDISIDNSDDMQKRLEFGSIADMASRIEELISATA